MSSPAILIEDLHKTYYRESQKLQVLQGLNLEIMPGEIVAIQGASGSGKSTLLNIIGSIDTYDSGRLEVAGINPRGLNERQKGEFRARSLGFIFQNHLLLPDFTLLENTAMPLLIQRMPKRQAYKKAAGLLASVGLAERTGHFPGQISGGESQRASIARSLAGGARIILADEPTGNLDNKTSDTIIELLWQLQKEHGFCLVIVTHDNDLARLADRRLLLYDHKIGPYTE